MYLIHEEGLLLRFCQQITSGMARLHQIDAIPKDLAARCCQVTHDHNIKVKLSNTLAFFLPIRSLSQNGLPKSVASVRFP